MECQCPIVRHCDSVVCASATCLHARRAASLPDSRAASLIDYSSLRLPAACSDFIPSVPPSRNVRRAAPATSSPSARFPPANRICPRISLSVTAPSYRLAVVISSLRPCRLSVLIWRRLDRLVAWLREGRGGEAWHTRSERIGTAPDSAGRICPIPYRMPVPAGHRGSGYPILILLRHGKRAGCGMRVETSIGCDIEHAGISRSPPKFHPM